MVNEWIDRLDENQKKADSVWDLPNNKRLQQPWLLSRNPDCTFRAKASRGRSAAAQLMPTVMWQSQPVVAPSFSRTTKSTGHHTYRVSVVLKCRVGRNTIGYSARRSRGCRHY